MPTRTIGFTCLVLLLAVNFNTTAAEKDLYGDPLPEGAKLRLGTARLRFQYSTLPMLSHDGKSLYMSAGGGLVRIDPATGDVKEKLIAPVSNPPTHISNNGKRAALVTFERVTVWDIGTGNMRCKIERRLQSHAAAAAISEDGNLLAIGGQANAGFKENVTVLIWDVSADKELKKLSVEQNVFANVALSGDGKTLATWGSTFDPEAKKLPDPLTNPNRFVTFWDVESGKERSRYRVEGYSPQNVVLNKSGELAAVSSNNSTVELVETKNGKCKHLMLGQLGMGATMAFSPDGTTIAASTHYGTVQRWTTADGSRITTTEAPLADVLATSVRVIDNEKAFAWGRRGTAVIVWEVPSGKLITPEGGHYGRVLGVAFSKDSKQVITSSDDGTTLRWIIETGKPGEPIHIKPPLQGMGVPRLGGVISPDQQHMLMRESLGISVYDLPTGKQQFVVPTPSDGSSSGLFSSDGKKLIVTSSSYDTSRVPARIFVWDIGTAKRVSFVEMPGMNSAAAAITPDGKHLVTAGRKPAEKGSGEFIITVWNAASGEKVKDYPEEAGYAMPFVAAASDNKTMAIVKSKGELIAFDIASGEGKVIDLKKRLPGTQPVFSHDGKLLAVACQADFSAAQTSMIYVVEWPTGTIKHEFAAPGGTPLSVAFSEDGKWLATGSADSTATVWNLSK